MHVRRRVPRQRGESRQVPALQGAPSDGQSVTFTRPFPFLLVHARYPGDAGYLPRFVFVRADRAGHAEVSSEFLEIIRFQARA